MNALKPKVMKDIKIEYDGRVYENVISLNRGYDYSSFHYLDDNGSEVSVYLQEGKYFNIMDSRKDE